MKKPQIVIANKMDMPSSNKNLEEFKKKVDVEVYPISAIDGKGLDKVIEVIASKLDKIKKEPLFDIKEKVMLYINMKIKKILKYLRKKMALESRAKR